MTYTEKKQAGQDVRAFGLGLLITATAVTALKQAPLVSALVLFSSGLLLYIAGGKVEGAAWKY